MPDNTPCKLDRPSAPPRRIGPWWLMLIALVASCVYANSLRNGFAFDDVAIVKDNPHVVNFEWVTIWRDNYWQAHDGMQPDVLYRPLTLWTYLANEALAPGLAWPFHLVNLLLHALVSVLVAQLAWRLLGIRAAAVLAGLLFAVHPLHTEAVANVVGRAELLAALWSLLALLVFLPDTPLKENAAPVLRPWWHGLLVAACFFLAMLSKETPATLLGAVVFIDGWRWLQWPAVSRPRWWIWLRAQTLRYYLPLAAAFGVYLSLRIAGPGLIADAGNVHPLVNLLVKATPAQRLVTPFLLLAKYLTLTFWPVHLSSDYSAPSILPTADPLEAGPALGILFCLLCVIMAVRWWRKRPQLSLLLGLFFLGYFLVSNIIRIGTIFGERLFYWPSIFVIILFAWAATSVYVLAARRRAIATRVTALLLLTAALGAMGYRTYVRNTDWTDNITLAVATGRDNPASAKACLWAGSMLVVANDPKYSDFGRSLLERAADLYPNVADIYWELAKDYGRHNDVGNSLIYLARVARLSPGTHNLQTALEGIRADLKRIDPDSYMPTLEKFRDKNPELAESYFALAVALHARGKWDLADEAAQKALQLGERHNGDGGDHFHEAAAEIALIRFDRGQTQEAISMYRQYVMRLHRSIDARCTMACMLISGANKHPDWLVEAEYNLNRADEIESQNSHVREIRGLLARTRIELKEHASASALMPDHKSGPELPAPAKASDEEASKGDHQP